MIKGLMGKGCIVVGGGNTALPYVGPNPNNPVQGMIRINNTDLEVFTGAGWQVINTSYATAELDTETIMLLEWARKKKREEESLSTYSHDHPAVKIAKQNLNKAKEEIKRLEEQLKITEILSQDETTTS
jgi:hypothetical protein